MEKSLIPENPFYSLQNVYTEINILKETNEFSKNKIFFKVGSGTLNSKRINSRQWNVK